MINILTVDTKKIKDNIDCFYCDNGTSPKYVVMNEFTLNLIKASLISFYVINNLDKTNSNFGTFCGIDIAICNSLENGEVVIV